MGWSIGYDSDWQRDIGYGVPALCDHPKCSREIDRGLSYVCGGEPYGGERGCGLFFCESHRGVRNLCGRCQANQEAWPAKPDVPRWIEHKLTHESWERWRQENPGEVSEIRQGLVQNRDRST